MTEPHWMAYVGMFTGIFGAITGFAGAIMSYVSYKKVNSLKSLDLRLELRKAVNVVHSNLSLLEKRIDYANKSRQAVASAKGQLFSGMMEQWKKGLEADTITVKQLSKNFQSPKDSFDSLNPQELETKLVEVHRLQVIVDQMRNKYDKAIFEYNQALLIDSEYIDAYFNKGLAERLLQDYIASKRDFESVVKLDPKSVDAIVLLGDIEEESNNYQEAKAFYEKALAINPEYSEGKSRLTKINELINSNVNQISDNNNNNSSSIDDQISNNNNNNNNTNDIIEHQKYIIEKNWTLVCDEAELNQTDRNLFWRRQFLNPFSFE